MIFSSEGSLGSPNESVCIMPEIILNKTNNGLMSTGHPENDFRLKAKYCHFLSICKHQIVHSTHSLHLWKEQHYYC